LENLTFNNNDIIGNQIFLNHLMKKIQNPEISVSFLKNAVLSSALFQLNVLICQAQYICPDGS